MAARMPGQIAAKQARILKAKKLLKRKLMRSFMLWWLLIAINLPKSDEKKFVSYALSERIAFKCIIVRHF